MKTRFLIIIGAIVIVFFASVLFAIPSWHFSNQEDLREPLYGSTVYEPAGTENNENETRIHGTIRVSESGVKFDDATVYVKIVDASMQDVPSILLTRQVIQNVSYDSNNDEKIRFSIPIIFDVQERRDYYVSAHADLDGDKSTSLGDYVTMTAYPVLTNGFPNEQYLILEKVN